MSRVETFEGLKRTPFRESIIVNGFMQGNSGTTRAVLGLEKRSDLVIRVEQPDPKSSVGDLRTDLLQSQSEFSRLREEYGIAVPNFGYVFGEAANGEPCYYAVVERVKGQKLRYLFDIQKIHSDSDMTPGLDELFVGLAGYFSDVYRRAKQDGECVFLNDISDCLEYKDDEDNEPYFVNQDKQYVWRSTPEDGRKRVYLVDVGPELGKLDYQFFEERNKFLTNNIGMFIGMIRRWEIKMGGDFQQSKNVLKTFLSEIPEKEVAKGLLGELTQALEF